jgi:hypothetical protein
VLLVEGKKMKNVAGIRERAVRSGAPLQVALRFIGNFAVFFFCGALIMQAIRRVRAPQIQQDPV